MKYGYARVSTNQQELETQIQTLQKEGCDVIYSEKYTGTKVDRVKFQELLSVLEKGDTLVVTKLDRFARTTMEGSRVIRDLFERGVRVNILNIGVMEDTPSGRLIFNIFMSFAEFERDMIMERTNEGKAIARQREGYREGRPKKFSRQQLTHALELLDTHSYKQVEEKTGISKSTLVREKNRRITNG